MNMKIFRTSVAVSTLALGLTLGFSPDAEASCRAHGLKGTWTVNGAVWENNGSNPGWFTCKMQISAKGKVSGKNSSCRSEDGSRTRIKGGQLKVNKACFVTGDVKLAPSGTIRLSGGRMSRTGHLFFNALGSLSNGPEQYFIFATRR